MKVMAKFKYFHKQLQGQGPKVNKGNANVAKYAHEQVNLRGQ